MFLKPRIAFSGMVLSAFLALAAAPAHATLVTFSTSGTFAGSGTILGGGTGVQFGSGGNTLTLTFNGINPAATVNTGTTFTFASLGVINTSTTGTGATIGSPLTLTINIAQLLPAGSGSLQGSLSGVISQSTSSGQIVFTLTGVTIAGVNYTVANNPLALVPPSTNHGDTSIQARIDANNVPEPLTSALVGLGLVGLASIRRLRKPL